MYFVFSIITILIILAHLGSSGNSSVYIYNQVRSKHRCSSEKMCDGLRKCKKHRCYGNSRPVKSAQYYFNQENNENGDCNKQNIYSDYNCDGNRKCSANSRCFGVAR